MHRLRTFLLALAIFALPSIARADYVTVTQGGNGPFACERDGGGPLPSWGVIEGFSAVNFAGACQRFRGDLPADNYGGHWLTFRSPHWPARSLRVSPQYTSVALCRSGVFADTQTCEGPPVVVTTSQAWTPILPVPQNMIVSYLPPCPLTPGMASLHACTGDYTPYDRSGLPTAVITDGIPQDGLPLGSPLKLQPATGTDVSCVATMADYPSVPNEGRAQWMAVYACP